MGILCAGALYSQPLTDSSASKIKIGGYGQVDYNQPVEKDKKRTGKLDVHRAVLLTGYQFSEKTSILTEIEFEHVKELYVEQAYISHRLHSYASVKAGLLLTPFGYINERHEPTEFNGVERPSLSGKVVPTTWREIGAGISGNIPDAHIKYQAYVMNGFVSYADGTGKIGGSGSFRPGRQKGAESLVSSPNAALRVNYYGIGGLNLGASYFGGKTQSDAYEGIKKNDSNALSSADSTVVGIQMLGLDAQFKTGSIICRTEVVYAKNKGNKAYNEKTGKDLGDAIFGYWADVAYDITINKQSWVRPFVRVEQYNNHFDTYFEANDSYNTTEIVIGAGYFPSQGAVFKIDWQLTKSASGDMFDNTLNAGIGFTF